VPGGVEPECRAPFGRLHERSSIRAPGANRPASGLRIGIGIGTGIGIGIGVGIAIAIGVRRREAACERSLRRGLRASPTAPLLAGALVPEKAEGLGWWW
jgi:hypothetical protein